MVVQKGDSFSSVHSRRGKVHLVLVISCLTALSLQLMASCVLWSFVPHIVLSPTLLLSSDWGSLCNGRRTNLEPTSLATGRRTYNDMDITGALIGEHESNETHSLNANNKLSLFENPQCSGRVQVLMGILTADFPNEYSY